MFKKKKKTVLEVLRQHNDIKLSNQVIFELFKRYENNGCEKDTIEKVYAYGDLCKLFSAYEFSEYGRCVVQEKQILRDTRSTRGLAIPACYSIDPTKKALVILKTVRGNLRIFKYDPLSTGDPVWLENLDYLQPKFDLYDVYVHAESTKSSELGRLVKSFDALTISSHIIALSKEHLNCKYFDGDENRISVIESSFPVILRY